MYKLFLKSLKSTYKGVSVNNNHRLDANNRLRVTEKIIKNTKMSQKLASLNSFRIVDFGKT